VELCLQKAQWTALHLGITRLVGAVNDSLSTFTFYFSKNAILGIQGPSSLHGLSKSLFVVLPCWDRRLRQGRPFLGLLVAGGEPHSRGSHRRPVASERPGNIW
jgi:hypothetical protein